MAQVWTVGHSNRTLDEFLELLQAHGIEAVADVRRFPGSRRHPHFGASALGQSLPEAGIDYHAFPDLGGRRSPRSDSHNTAWKNAGFRGYADYMETPAFHTAVTRLLSMAEVNRTALMCAEALWWRCHRGLISDHLQSTGHSIHHILTPSRAEAHPYTSAARIIDGSLSYTAVRGATLFEE